MKRIGQVSLLYLLTLTAGMPLATAAGPAPEQGVEHGQNAIQGIRIEEKAGSVQVIITGSTTPSFTVFKLQDPLRVFIDIAGADLSAIREPLRVDNGLVDQIVTMQLKDERKAVGRVIVGMDRSVPYHLRAEGNQLIMSIAGSPGVVGHGAGEARRQEIRQLEQEVRSRLATEEARLEQRRQAIAQDLGRWEQRKEEAHLAAAEQEGRLQRLTEELNQAAEKRRLLDRALQEAEGEREALQSSRSEDEAKRSMAQEARLREEQLLRAAQQARSEVEKRRQAAEDALAIYEQQKAHLAGLKSEVAATQATLSELQAEQVRLQQTRMADEEQLARLRQSQKDAQRRRAEAEAQARTAEQSRAEAEKLAGEATRRREEAERAGAAAAAAALARQAEQSRHAELLEAVAQVEQQRKAVDEALRREEERRAAIVQARTLEEQRMARLTALTAEEEKRLADYLAASRKAAAATQEAEQKLAALRLAEQQEEARLQAAGKSRQREEARAAAAADLRQQEEARTAAAGEVRRQEEARAAAAAEARRKEEALLKATAEAGKRQAEASAASKARLERSTAKSRRQEEAAKATLAAALARVAALQAELEQKKDEARQSAARVEELKAQEVGLAATMARMRQEAEAGDAKERATVQTRQELVRAKEETAAALKQARQASRQVVELKKQAEAALSKAEETRAELSRARELASRVETAEAEARAARADLEQVTRALGEARQTTSQTQQELQQARRGGEQERQRAERLGQELASLRRQMEAHRSEAQPRQPSAGEVLALQEEMARLKREAQSATMAVAEAKKLSAMASEENERARQLRQGSPASRGRSPDEMAELTRRAALAAATAAGATAAPTAAAATATSAGAPAPARPAPPPPTMQIGDIRFEDGADRSTVIVEHRGQADYMVQEVANGSVVLHLARARLPRALERTLDTTELPTSVRAVSSFAGDPRSGDAWVVVTLDEPVESHVRKEEGRLRWEFLKTGAPAEGGTVRGKGSAAAAPRRGERAVRYPPQRVAGYSAAGSAGYGRQVEAGRERFTGKRITLDLRDADIHNVLRLLAKEGRINIIASEEVAGTITMHLERIPWDQALDVLLKTKGLTQSKEGEIIWITPLATLREQQKMEMEVKKVKQELDPLEVRLVTVNYADVASLSQQAATLLSSRGATSVDPRTKTMIIKDVPDHAEAVEDLARRLDTQTPLVLIEGRIVEADSSLRKDFGIQWGGDYLMSPASGNPTGLRFPSVVGVSGGADDMQVSTEGLPVNPNFVVNLPAAAGGGAGGALGFTFGSLGGAANLNVRLSAMEDQGSLKIVSSPKVSTLDNSTATISQGVSIPIAVISAQGVNTVFFDANLQLQVTPHVTQDGHVLLDIKISKNTPDFSRTGARGDPTILRKETTTSMMIKDGDTTVIGGIFTQEKTHNMKKVPFFGDIPILGTLFSFRSEQEKRSELLIFITPRIVNRSEAVVRGGKAGGGATFK